MSCIQVNYKFSFGRTSYEFECVRTRIIDLKEDFEMFDTEWEVSIKEDGKKLKRTTKFRTQEDCAPDTIDLAVALSKMKPHLFESEFTHSFAKYGELIYEEYEDPQENEKKILNRV